MNIDYLLEDAYGSLNKNGFLRIGKVTENLRCTVISHL